MHWQRSYHRQLLKWRRACRAHLEEDAGKNMHGGGEQGGVRHSLVDLNRAGVPLLEIVTEPEFASGAEAAAYGAELRRIVRFLGISDGNMQVRLRPPPHPPAKRPCRLPDPEQFSS